MALRSRYERAFRTPCTPSMKALATIGFLGLMLATSTVGAQQRPASAPAQSASTEALTPNALLDAGWRVAQAMDQGQAAGLWNDASSVAKHAVKRDDFVSKAQEARKPLGAVSVRNWIALRRALGDGKSIPAGVYSSVEFATTFGQNRTMRELVSFRLDEDNVWRLSGYTLQP